jgi:hypothetical protein
MSDEEKNATAPRKLRPGRPRKTPIRTPKPKNGIVANPSDGVHFIEFLYDKPLVFKKLWQFFRLMAVDKIQINFTKDHIFMWCNDHHKKSHMRIKINCSEVNHYYCEDELEIGLLCNNPELVMNTIDKTCNSILFLSTQDNTQKNIQIVLKNDIDFEEIHKIELIGEYNRTEDDGKFMDEDYAIKFKLPGKYFKKMISDIRSFSDQATIRQDGYDEPLTFEYIKNDKKVKSLHVAKNSKSISLESTLDEDDTFRTSFKVDYVRPISSAVLAEHITIYADENKPLMFIIQMDDKAVEMKILTDIIDNRDVDI